MLTLVLSSATAGEAASIPAPARIVTLGSGVTETVHALGRLADVVAVDQSSQFPVEVKALPQIGYFRFLSLEPLLALQPTVVLASASAGPPQVLEGLRRAGVNVVTVPESPSAEGITTKLAAIGTVLDRDAEAQQLVAGVQAEFAALEQALAADPNRPTAVYLLSAGNAGLQAAGSGTLADAILGLAGVRNAFHASAGYQPVNPEALFGLKVDYVILSERTLMALGGREALKTNPAFTALAALPEDHFVLHDDAALLGLGPRTPAAIRELLQATHPGMGSTPPAAASVDAP